MDPTEALKHLRVLIRAAYGAEDLPAVQKLLREMERLVEKGQAGPTQESLPTPKVKVDEVLSTSGTIDPPTLSVRLKMGGEIIDVELAPPQASALVSALHTASTLLAAEIAEPTPLGMVSMAALRPTSLHHGFVGNEDLVLIFDRGLPGHAAYHLTAEQSLKVGQAVLEWDRKQPASPPGMH